MAAKAPPMPPSEAQRVEITRLRRRMQGGKWKGDLEDRMRKLLGGTRYALMRELADASSNTFRMINRERASLYLTMWQLRHASGADELVGEDGAIARSGLHGRMARYQAHVLACREYLMRVHAPRGGRSLQFRPVYPDYVYAESTMDQPDVPVFIMEAREREAARGHMVWTYDVLDIRDPQRPVYTVHEAEPGGRLGADISRFVLAEDGVPWRPLIGDAYPYWRQDNKPVLPYVLHHAERLGDRLWDPWEEMEVVEGALNLAVLLTSWNHLMFDASWPQRYAAGARPRGLETVDQDGIVVRHEIVTDPTSLLEFEIVPTDEGTTPSPVIGQFQPGGDPEVYLRSVDAYGARVAADSGVAQSDIHKMSGDARSGYAIQLTNEGKRAQQRRYMPHFREIDQQMVALSAVLYNRANNTSLPEDGYTVVYGELPMSPDELEARREHATGLLDKGLMSPTSAYMHMNPGITREQARQDLEAIRTERAELMAADTDGSEDKTLALLQAGLISKAEARARILGEKPEEAEKRLPAVSESPLVGIMQTVAEIVAQVAEGRLPRDAGVAQIARAYGITPAEAEPLLGSAGTHKFTPTTAE